MNISNVNVRITESDILGIINENLKIKELSINNIKIGELISVKGIYKKGINIRFIINLGIGSIEENVLKLKIIKFKIGILPIWTNCTSYIAKNILKTFKNMGITSDKDMIYIDFNILCNYLKSVNFILKHITLFKNSADVCLENLVYKEELQENNDILSLDDLKNKMNNEINKENEEGYSKFREHVTDSFQEEYKYIAEYILLIPDIIILLYGLMRDDRVDKKTKALVGMLVSYLALPVDIIPDSIPIIGKIDDFGIGFMLLDKIIDSVPEKIIIEHWQGKDNIIAKVKEGKNLLVDSIGRKNTIVVLNKCMLGVKKLFHRKRK